MVMIDNKKYKACKKCGHRAFFKRDLYMLEEKYDLRKLSKDKYIVEEKIKTILICNNCLSEDI